MTVGNVEPYLPAVVVIALLLGGLVAAGAGAAQEGQRSVVTGVSIALVVLAVAVGFLVLVAVGLSRAFG